ncbi:LysR family transcriptional regulator [Paenibacillus senegalimassiliensis]|uniref:LysR family transcriptional regulator n=1 Tax=Paenibacillus senegalimassiliensis TaxID=1737426 RepID=UPI00073FA021|nr:LysR family transcriptional regulator [Paenibacillus senegalimassiliensis]
MEWQQLEYFQTVARLEHFTQAAAELNISQPALSRAMAGLEAELGVALFDRQGRGVRLNRYGKQFFERVERALLEIHEGKEELRHGLNPEYGTVSFCFLKSLGLAAVPRLLGEFIPKYPHIGFKLNQLSTQDMLDLLVAGETDFALSSMTETRPGVEWCELWQEQLYAYVPCGHRLAGAGHVSLAELATEPYIALKPGYGLRTISEELFGLTGTRPAILLEGEEIMTVIGFVSAGLGVSLLPDIPHLSPTAAVRLEVDDERCRRTIGLAWRQGGVLSPAAERFRSYLLSR